MVSFTQLQIGGSKTRRRKARNTNRWIGGDVFIAYCQHLGVSKLS
jgi:hypothetical protein